MKFATLALLGVAAAEEKPQVVQDYILLTEGFVQGAIQAEGLTDIQKCITDGVTIAKDAEAAYTDFKAHDISHVMQDCSSMSDWAKLKKIADNFSSPKSFVWHL